ncbi:MAG: BTAD domain-containing putative transcriptional regulator [Caldilineaceae bacterium]
MVTLGDNSLANLGSRKAQALLAYLAVAAKPVARDTLVALLWTEMPEQAAKNNLRTTLTSLKQQLGSYLVITTSAVAFNRQLPYQLDVENLDKQLDAALATQHVEALQAAVALYQGEFLQGLHLRGAALFEEWLLQQRENRHLRLLDVLEMLITLCVQQHEYTIGIDAAHRWLTLEPWSEVAHRHLMSLWAANGQRDQALRQFERCRRVLADELGVEPSAETVDLYRSIQAGRYSGADPALQLSLPVPPTPAHPQPQSTAVDQPPIPHNLPTPLAAFIGRQQELAWLDERLTKTACRLLTITGPGGMGKTSLAVAIGQHFLRTQHTTFPDGIFFVPLTDITNTDITNTDITNIVQADGEPRVDGKAVTGEAILRTVAEQLNTQLDIRLSSIQQLHAYLRPRRLLLILDNFEHLLAGVQTIVTLLSQAPQLKILVTSRFRLNLRGESLLPLGKLSLPPAASLNTTPAQPPPAKLMRNATWQESDAILMFVQRAQLLDSHFAVTAENVGPISRICQLVDGLPLGIELATSMLPLLGCDELAAELTTGLDFLVTETRDLPHDQRTLAAVFDRSWRLLEPESQQLLARLAIFPGSFQRDAAATIAEASGLRLKRLLDRSLVSTIGADRYILHRTIQTFAQQKLQQWPEQIPTLQQQYARFYLEFLSARESGLFGNTYGETVEQINADLDNVRMAWRQAVTHHMYSELGQAFSTLFWFYEQQGFYLDVIDLYDDTLHRLLPIYDGQQQKTGTDLSLLIGRLYSTLGVSYLRSGQFTQALAAYEVSWSILQEEDSPNVAVQCLMTWGKSIAGHDVQRAKALLTQSLALVQKTNNDWLRALVYQVLGESSFLFGDYAAAERQVMEGYTLANQIAWPRGLVSGHKALGRIKLTLGRYRQAEAHLRQSITLARQHHLKLFYLESMTTLGEALALQGTFAEANVCFAESRKLAEELGVGVLVAPILWEEGSLAEQRGDYQAAKACFTQSLKIGLPNWWVHALPTLGWALIGLGERVEAQHYFQTVLADAQAKERIPILLDAQAGLAYLALLQAGKAHGDGGVDRETIGQTLTTFQQIRQHPAATQQTRDRIAQLASTLGVDEAILSSE